MPAPSPLQPIDHVDASDRSIGSIPRQEVFRRQAGFRVVHVFLFDGRNQLLLQRIGRLRQRNPLLWGSSVAGYLHQGESYLQAAERRLFEELGVRSRLAKHGSISMLDSGARKFITLYTTRADDPQNSAPEHIEELRWWALDRLDRALLADAEQFTETFRHVYEFFRRTRDLVAW